MIKMLSTRNPVWVFFLVLFVVLSAEAQQERYPIRDDGKPSALRTSALHRYLESRLRSASSGKFTESFSPTLANNFQNALDGTREYFNIKGSSVSVIIPGQGTWNGVSGESVSGVPINSDMLFGLASITKNFIAALVLKLAEQGKLSLEDPLSRWLPDYPYVDHDITIRQLLNHTSGLWDVLNDDVGKFNDSVWFNPTRYWPPEEILTKFMGPPHFARGTAYSYSNTNFLIASMIAKAATGSSLVTQIHQQLLDPLGLTHVFNAVEEPLVGTRAHGWSDTYDNYYETMTGPYSFAWGYGSMYASAEDLAKWTQALNTGQVISQSSLSQMLNYTPQSLVFSGSGIGGFYGLGTFMEMDGGHIVHGHDGLLWGYRNLTMYDPESGISIAVLTNEVTWSSDYFAYVEDILSALLDEYRKALPTSFPEVAAGLPGVNFSSLAWGDYDNDGKPDLLLTGTTDGTGAGAIAKIFRNDNGVFHDIGAILPGVCYSSVAWRDYDGDGDSDLVITGLGTDGNPLSRIYRNDGNGTFTDITAGLTGVSAGSAAWGDFDRDGKPDLLITGSTGSNSMTILYHNNGDNTFTEVTGTGLAGVSQSSVAVGDYDHDGYPDIFLSGTTDGSGPVAIIYHNNGNGTFTDIGAGLDGVVNSSSGAAAWGDYDNDGRLDLVYSGRSLSSRITILLHNNGNGSFTENINTGFAGVRSASLSWGDYDNDGSMDLLMTGSTGLGFVGKIYRNNGDGTFTDIDAALSEVYLGSAVWGDFDGDGAPDILISGSKFQDGTGQITKLYKNNSRTPISVGINHRWNLISLPVQHPASHSAHVLFPGSTGQAYAYLGNGYVPSDTLAGRMGYWLKFSSTAPADIGGLPRVQDTITLRPGWNLIGSISYPVDASSIYSIPAGITTSQFFGYSDQYTPADTVQPGKGYWVKVNGACSLVLSAGPASPISGKSAIRIIRSTEFPPPPPDEAETQGAVAPKEYSLDQNYPNPFNPSTVVRYSLPADSRVMLRIYNTLGQAVAVLDDGTRSAGNHATTWNSPNAASGFYYYRLDASGLNDPSKHFTQVRKMLLVR